MTVCRDEPIIFDGIIPIQYKPHIKKYFFIIGFVIEPTINIILKFTFLMKNDNNKLTKLTKIYKAKYKFKANKTDL